MLAGWTAFPILLLSAVSALVAPESPVSRPVAPLSDAICDLPGTLAGVAGHALLRYRVGPDGQVDRVETLYLTADPEEARTALKAAVGNCLREWRYRPALRDGSPVPASLITAMHFFHPAEGDDPLVALPDGRTLPQTHLETLRREKVAFAMARLGEQVVEVDGGAWLLRTDLPPEEARAIAGAIERTGALFDAVFPEAPALPRSSHLVIFLFASDEAFRQVTAFDSVLSVGFPIAGQYSAAEQLIFSSAGGAPARTIGSVLAHEASHHHIFHRLFRDGRRPPFWVNEGIACFVAGLAPGRTGGVDLSAIDRRNEPSGWKIFVSKTSEHLEALEGALAAGRLPPLEEFLDGRIDGDLPPDLTYGMSWLVVHYLMTAEDGRYRKSFSGWLVEPDAPQTAAGLEAALGAPLAGIERELPAHLRSMLGGPPGPQVTSDKDYYVN